MNFKFLEVFIFLVTHRNLLYLLFLLPCLLFRFPTLFFSLLLFSVLFILHYSHVSSPSFVSSPLFLFFLLPSCTHILSLPFPLPPLSSFFLNLFLLPRLSWLVLPTHFFCHFFCYSLHISFSLFRMSVLLPRFFSPYILWPKYIFSISLMFPAALFVT